MAAENVFTVNGTSATAAEAISLMEAGLKEREHLQEWVIQHPQILGEDVMIIAFEFGRWSGSGAGIERDRLDVLGLDREGRLVVVELKRDKAPDTIEMQALKYAALVSRFTRDDLDQVHAQYLTRTPGEQVTPEEAAAEIDDWATITEDSLRDPRLVLMASEFPRTVTATIVFLHQQLGMDVQLLAFQAYRTGTEILLTVSQHYPPPEVEEFVLSPEVVEAKQQRTVKKSRNREATAVSRILGAEALPPGAPLVFRCPIGRISDQVAEWIASDPRRGRASWQEDHSNPLVWEADGLDYTPTGLARHILEEAAGYTTSVQGPICWVDEDGATLVELANTLPAGTEVPIEVHLDKISSELRPLFDAVDQSLGALGDDVERRPSPSHIRYFATKKLVDLLIHKTHLSLYIRTATLPPDPAGLIVSDKTPNYVHAKISALADLGALMDLVGYVYQSQQT